MALKWALRQSRNQKLSTEVGVGEVSVACTAAPRLPGALLSPPELSSTCRAGSLGPWLQLLGSGDIGACLDTESLGNLAISRKPVLPRQCWKAGFVTCLGGLCDSLAPKSHLANAGGCLNATWHVATEAAQVHPAIQKVAFAAVTLS